MSAHGEARLGSAGNHVDSVVQSGGAEPVATVWHRREGAPAAGKGFERFGLHEGAAAPFAAEKHGVANQAQDNRVISLPPSAPGEARRRMSSNQSAAG